MPTDPLEVVMPPGVRRWPTHLQTTLASELLPAGVLVPIIMHHERLSVLLTQRSADLKHHAGQISFPGGRMEQGDDNIRDTALRETFEEVGIDTRAVEIAGYLDPAPTVTGYAVTPVVGLIGAGLPLKLDRREVDEAFEVPLEFLMDRNNQEYSEREYRGARVPVIEFNFDGWRIWGATASILVSLQRKLIINR